MLRDGGNYAICMLMADSLPGTQTQERTPSLTGCTEVAKLPGMESSTNKVMSSALRLLEGQVFDW